MSLLFYLMFVLLIFITTYYFIYLENINRDNLYYIILNFIFLIILPLYYSYFEDLIYGLIISLMLLISAFILNLKIKEIFHEVKIFPFFYFIIVSAVTAIILTNFL